jgi:hypothetical protein
MGEGTGENSKPFDPFDPLRGVRDAYLDAMAKSMIEAVNSEGYAQATGAMLDTYLTASAPFRDALEKSMVHALEKLSLPSRQELAVLAERFTNVEMRLDDMDAKLDEIAKRSAAAEAAPRPGPPESARSAARPAEPAKAAQAPGHATQKRAAARKANSARPQASRKSGR